MSIQTDLEVGAGLIYDSDGIILTNTHVVEGDSQIVVRLADGRHFEGEVMASSTDFDLALLKIETNDLPEARLGDSSELQIGQFAVAIGNPYGYNHTVTTGIVSALNRPSISTNRNFRQPMIQIDTPINPGNSGGPLIDLDGNIVGINTERAAFSGNPAQGIAFAIPINSAKLVIPQLVEYGKVIHSGQSDLGLTLSDLSSLTQPDRETNRWFGRWQPQAPVDYGVAYGVFVQGAVLEGPAANTGIQLNDVIVTFDGHEVYTLDELTQYLVLKSPGEEVGLEFVRGGKSIGCTLILGEASAQ